MTEEIPDFDLYAELEVSERASPETIQAAYRSLQLRNHPDRAGGTAGDRAVRLNIAREWLADPVRRARYDAFRSTTRSRAAEDRASAAAPGSADDAEEAAGAEEAETGADATRPRPRPLHLLRRHLRIDPWRLGRVWTGGLAVLGAAVLLPPMAAPPWLRPAVALGVVALLGFMALGWTRRGEGTGVRAALLRWSGMLVGRALLLGLAIVGLQGLIRLAQGEPAPASVADTTPTTLAACAVLSLLAIRRRHGPFEVSVDEFLAMTPREFEAEVGRILGRHGYRLTVTGGPGDLVADLAGTDPDGRPAIVQCKRYAPGHPVGSRDVQLLIAMGVRHHAAERLVLVTTSDFTDPARDLAEEHGVDLVSGEDLEDLAG